MMVSMDYIVYIAVAVGILVTLLRLIIKDKLEQIVVSLAGFKHRNEEDFLVFYDHMSEGVYQLFIDVINSPKVKTRDAFYKLHDKARGDIYKLFCHYRNQAMKDVLLRVSPVILLPAILFWQNWYYYLLGVGIAFSVLIAYRLIVNDDSITNGDLWLLSLAYRKYLKMEELS